MDQSISSRISYNAAEELIRDVSAPPSLREAALRWMINNGDSKAFPLLTRLHPNPDLMFDYFIQLDKRGLINKEMFSAILKILDLSRFDDEDRYKTFVENIKGDSALKSIVKRVIQRVAYRRSTASVAMIGLSRVYVRPPRAPDDPNARAYDLTVHVRFIPKNMSYARLIIINPQGEFPQNCDDSGRKDCQISKGKESFRVFLNINYKKVEAHLRYYNGDEKYIGRSNSFAITNPDAK